MVIGTMTNQNLMHKPLFDDENQLNDINNSTHSLTDIISPEQFKSMMN